jgi:alkylhydroperoxidase/carboxymuconolactone decarboxylase family protein YurZ
MPGSCCDPMTGAATGADLWGSSLDESQGTGTREGVDLLFRAGTNPWNSGVLPRKEVQLLCLALHVACTNLDAAGTRRHVRGALDAGATRDEIILVFKSAAVLALHSFSLGAPILLEEMAVAGVTAAGGPKPDTPSCDALRAMGQWNTAFDPFLELAPSWTEDYFAFAVGSVYQSGVFTPRFIELISIALDASVTHMYAPGVRRHIKGALKAARRRPRSRRSFSCASRWAWRRAPWACRSWPRN